MIPARVPQTSEPVVSGERFAVTYRIRGDEQEALAKAQDICVEQTVEFPASLVPKGLIRESVVGRIETFAPDGAAAFRVVISYAEETAAGELTQLINVIFGNISLKPGIRVEELDLPNSLLKTFKGPRFGVSGLRERWGVWDRPLMCTALKPMGLSSIDLAEMAYQFALGGTDLIKDDHGLSNQPFAPFEERVARCSQAIERANRETGQRSQYWVNITADGSQLHRRARLAKEAGAGALMLAPALIGYGAVRALADDDTLALPIVGHPTFQGSLVTHPENGISHQVLFGQLARLAGIDVSIFPNFGGRFSFSLHECKNIIRGTRAPMGQIKPIFPGPGGGMSLSSVTEMRGVYGKDVIFLIGGGLFQHGPDLVENCRFFRRLVESGG